MSSKDIVRRCLGMAAGLSMLLASQIATAAVGSGNVATADPGVPRPPSTPCVVVLFSDVSFDDFSAHPYSYAPPAGCQGRWSKVVLEGDFSVTAGRQYDRTATLWLGGVNLYFGTTQEPSAAQAPSWHVERDLTDYTALLKQPGQGQAFIGNIVNATYTGVIHGSARLLFYPASILAPAPPVADAVYPLGSDPLGSTTSLDTAADQLAKTLTLPRNVEHAYLDVFTQSQGGDEFWYTCVPDVYASEVQECGGGNFREAEISIDGQAAGVAPVYPWIYTGGIDPYLWRPTPGVQTLNFQPYRVDLTPFAGLLSDGAPHRVALSVAGANGSFSATAALLVYQDPHASQVGGQLTRNTLAGQPPMPTVGDTLVTDGAGNVSGDITTRLRRSFVVEGYADTSHGRITTTVSQTVGFDDVQSFTINATTYRQKSVQTTTADSVSQSRRGVFPVGEYRERVSYPLQLDYDETVAADGSGSVASAVSQGYHKHGEQRLLGLTLYAADVDNTVDAGDTLNFDATGAVSGHAGQYSTQAFNFHDSFGGCYRRSLQTQGGVLSDYQAGFGCPGKHDRLFWFSHPDGSPDNVSRW